MKDVEGRYVYFNRQCRKYFGVDANQQILGKSDRDMSHANFSDNYIRDDREILATGKPIVDRMELIMDPGGVVRWHLTTKLPLRDAGGNVIGILGHTRPVVQTRQTWESLEEFGKVLEWIDENIRSEIRIADLAEMMNLSLSSFERRFRREFHMTPKRYIMKIRIASACRDLLSTGRTVTEIAYDYGYCDQSHFCKEFRRLMGTSPGRYRSR